MTMLRFPDDADGESLRRLHEKGDRLEVSRAMDLYLVFQRQRDAEKFCTLLEAEGLDAGVISPMRKGGRWTANVVTYIVPTYENLAAFKTFLERFALPLGGKHSDWGCHVILPNRE